MTHLRRIHRRALHHVAQFHHAHRLAINVAILSLAGVALVFHAEIYVEFFAVVVAELQEIKS